MPGKQNPSTIPEQPCHDTCDHAERELRRQARQAGEIVHDPLHPCCDCTIYEDGDLNSNGDCELCRTNPEPDPDNVVLRPIQWLHRALDTIAAADRARTLLCKPLTDLTFQKQIKQALTDLNDDVERLVSLL